MLPILIDGLLLGFANGISPGPLTVFAITQTTRFGLSEGIKASVGSLSSDLVIVPVSILIFNQSTSVTYLAPIVGLIGVLFLIFLAYKNLLVSREAFQVDAAKTMEPKSVFYGALLNLTNPYPYMFWITVGASLLTKMFSASPIQVPLFLLAFYSGFIFAKLCYVFSTKFATMWLSGIGPIYVTRISGLVFLFMAIRIAVSLEFLR